MHRWTQDIRNTSTWTPSSFLLLYFFSPTSLSLCSYLFSLMFFYVQHKAHLFKENPGPSPPGCILKRLLSLHCHRELCSHMASAWLWLSCWIIALILFFLSFLPPSSASSQSPAADPRKSCCLSVLAYVIPTYLYVILCNVFCCSINTPNNIPGSTALCGDESCWTEQSRLMSGTVFVITIKTSVKRYSRTCGLASSLGPRCLDLACENAASLIFSKAHLAPEISLSFP